MDNPYVGVAFRFKNRGVGNLEDRDISFDEIDEKLSVTIHIRSSKNDRCKMGVNRTLVATNFELFPVMGIAQWLDVKNLAPIESTNVMNTSISTKINRFLNNRAVECGLGPGRMICHSMRDGRDTNL